MLSVWLWRIFVVGVFVYLIAKIIDLTAIKNKDDD